MAFRTNKMPTLQTKSASGSVATFNTALAMPLPSCNIAVNAWQEGSGDPSPDNVRPIHGFDKSVVTQSANGNQLKTTDRVFGEPSRISFDSGTPRTFTDDIYTVSQSSVGNINIGNGTFTAESLTEGNQAYSVIGFPIIGLKNGATYYLSMQKNSCTVNVSFYKEDGTYISGLGAETQSFVVPYETKYTVLLFRADAKGVFGASNIMLSLVSGASYEPYVTPTIYTIQLGEEVYGAEVDVVNGVATVTHKLVDMTTISWSYISSYAHSLFSGLISDSALGVADETNILCSIYKPISARPPKDMGDISNPLCICQRVTSAGLLVQDDNYTSKADFEASLSNAYVVYPLAEPFDIQLTPTQIQTLIGNNTIFCDTGDIDLTYKDLDIAKRGNFREVFKLPS